MSALIHHFVVHQFVINEQQELALIPKSSCFDVTPEIEDLAQQINHAFNNKPGKGVGGFVDTDSFQPPETSEEDDIQISSEHLGKFRVLLEDMKQNPDNFVEFSIKSSDLLKKKFSGNRDSGNRFRDF